MVIHIALYLLSFVGIWMGAGLAIGSVEKISKSLKLSSFSVSFLLLGFLTSIGELSVGVNSVLNNDPEIFVGNLIGASIVLFLLVIPLLAISDNSIKIKTEFQGRNLLLSLFVIAAPVILSLDGTIGFIDAIIAIILYTALTLSIETKKGLLEKIVDVAAFHKIHIPTESIKIITGIIIIFASSKLIVDQTIYFSELLNLSPFFISLLLIGIGTNIPELSLVVRSIFQKSNQVAFGDYIGSAAFNTYLFGFLLFMYGKPIHLTNNYLISLSFLIVGLTFFYIFAKSKNTLSRKEGLILLGIYAIFIISEIYLHIT